MRDLPALGGDCSRIMASSAEAMGPPASEPAFAPWRWAAPGPASRIPYATFSPESWRNLQWFSQESRKSSSPFTPVWSFGSEQDCSAQHQTAGISPTPALDGGQQSGINAVCWLPTPFSETQVHCSPPARSLPEWKCWRPMQHPLFCVTAESDRHSRNSRRSKTPRVSFVRSRCASGQSSQRGQ